MKKQTYQDKLRALQIELTKMQRAHAPGLLVIFEGRDAAGKDGTIKRIVEHLSPRGMRVVALSAPTDLERASWYFQRWTSHLPATGEFVLFNRSWYNRAGVERVMGFASKDEVASFLRHVPAFEHMLTDSGIVLRKYYLDVSRDEEAKRLKQRASDPLTQWKTSPIDAKAIDRWDDYSTARNEMLEATHTKHAPWTVVRADNKRKTRLAVIQHLLSTIDYPKKSEDLLRFDEDRIRTYKPALVESDWLAR